MSSQNGNNDNSENKEKDNIIRFKPRPKKTENSYNSPANEPLINLPSATKYLAAIIIAVHILFYLILDGSQLNKALLNFGFVSGYFTGREPFQPLALLSIMTHIFIHGSWLHLGMNIIMLVAFGSGIEKWVGAKTYLIIFFGSAMFGLAAHFGMNLSTIHPVIGASGGISGLFAAALIMLQRTNRGIIGHQKYGLWPIIALWIGITLLFGLIGSPDGNIVSWEAHLGGFLGGFVMIKILKL